MKKSIIALVAVVLLAVPVLAQGTDPAAELKELKMMVQKQEEVIQKLMQRIESLEAQGPGAAKADGKEVKAAQWSEKTVLKGDFRYRHELIGQENAKARNRQRIRARIGMDTNLGDDVKLGFQLASGSDDPASTNQTLDGGFSTKGFQLDLAYMDWSPSESSHLAAGKIKNLYTKPGSSKLIWDSDLNPEGIFYEYTDTTVLGKFFANLGAFWVEENSSSADSGLIGSQAGYRFAMDGGRELLVGAGYFDYINTEGEPTFYNNGNPMGNSMDAGGKYLYDFNEFELFADYSFKLNETPLSIYMDYVKNTAADSDDSGWLLGLSAGKCKAFGSWEGSLSYKRLESDAVIGIFTDSDFIGGGTDGKGFELGLGYQVASKVKAGLTYFMNEKGLAAKTGYNKLQLDMNFKF